MLTSTVGIKIVVFPKSTKSYKSDDHVRHLPVLRTLLIGFFIYFEEIHFMLTALIHDPLENISEIIF